MQTILYETKPWKKGKDYLAGSAGRIGETVTVTNKVPPMVYGPKCDCGFEAKSELGLKIHKSKHKV